MFQIPSETRALLICSRLRNSVESRRSRAEISTGSGIGTENLSRHDAGDPCRGMVRRSRNSGSGARVAGTGARPTVRHGRTDARRSPRHARRLTSDAPWHDRQVGPTPRPETGTPRCYPVDAAPFSGIICMMTGLIGFGLPGDVPRRDIGRRIGTSYRL
jgi:hypothetical protein